MSCEIICGDALTVLRGMEDARFQCCVTSPPYWGLRDYKTMGQIGLETTPEEYVARLVEVFREVRRVLRDDGTLWLNLGDSYCANGKGGRDTELRSRGKSLPRGCSRWGGGNNNVRDLKTKDLIGIPWRVAFALQADGWWLRSDIIWAKPNPMPESITDRPTKAHEYLFLLAKSARYYYDAKAIAEPAEVRTDARAFGEAGGNRHGDEGRVYKQDQLGKNTYSGFSDRWASSDGPERPTRNSRSVWTIATAPFPEAHFATFPPELPRRCILAGSRPGDAILDPFAGAGTTGLVADRLGRNFIGIDLNSDYCEMARKRIASDAPLFNETPTEE